MEEVWICFIGCGGSAGGARDAAAGAARVNVKRDA